MNQEHPYSSTFTQFPTVPNSYVPTTSPYILESTSLLSPPPPTQLGHPNLSVNVQGLSTTPLMSTNIGGRFAGQPNIPPVSQSTVPINYINRTYTAEELGLVNHSLIPSMAVPPISGNSVPRNEFERCVNECKNW
jgi:hypothetical protein